MQLAQIINSPAVPFSSVPQIINTGLLFSQQNYSGIPSVIKDNYSPSLILSSYCFLDIYFGPLRAVFDVRAVSKRG